MKPAGHYLFKYRFSLMKIFHLLVGCNGANKLSLWPDLTDVLLYKQ
jgi:hypothetical protein